MAHPGHVYHWKHGWIPLDHTAALSKAKGNHEAAKKMLADAHGPHAGIHSREHVAKAALGLSRIESPADRSHALRQVQDAADKHGAQDSLPGALRRPTGGPMARGMVPVSEAANYKMDKTLNEAHVEALTQQMKAAGRYVGDPLIIEETNRGPLLTDGHHRLEAARRAGISKVPVEHYANTPAGRLAAMKRLNEAERKKN